MTSMSAPPRSRWLICRAPKPDALVNLYCFAHAGGSPGEYARWSDDLPGVRVWAVQLPGRGSRLTEPPYTRMAPLVEAITEEVPFERPFALFGHSLGGLVAFEVARALRRTGREPDRLFLSSCPPPPVPHTRAPIHTLPDAELLAEIERRWGALPAQVHRDPKLRAVVLGCFRADIELYETYDHVPGEPLDCPVTVFAGEAERTEFPFEEWHRHTRGPIRLRFLPGGHFYLRPQRPNLLRLIHQAMTADEIGRK